MIAENNQNYPEDNNGCAAIGCIFVLSVVFLFTVLPLIDLVFRWWF